MATGCRHDSPSDTIYKCDEYQVYIDSVVQGPYTARALSPLEIVTDYHSAIDSSASPLVHFRFSINSRDNEFAQTMTHSAIIGDSVTSERIYRFGDTSTEGDSLPGDARLRHNVRWKVQLDMHEILESFERRGFYITPTGDKIARQDFKGVWIAGDIDPLTWDFDNLHSSPLHKLKDRGDSIYEITLTVNPAKTLPSPTGWKASSADSNYPEFECEQRLPAALYNMSIAELAGALRPDGCYGASLIDDEVWTRDASYAIYLSLAMLDPANSMRTLRSRVRDGVIIQDKGTGGAWPVASDRIVWGIAAWEVYMSTGDSLWLREAYNVLARTLNTDLMTIRDSRTGLMHGETSFLNWRQQTYPSWMQPKDIYESMSLSTNALFAQACRILGLMRDALASAESDSGTNLVIGAAPSIRKAVNTLLWIPDKGYYSSYLYGGYFPVQSPTTDNLGQALAIIFGIAYDEMAESIIANTPVLPYGVPAAYPQIEGQPIYHNNAVWPFVQSLWNIAAARVGNMEALSAGIAALYRPAALFGCNRELFSAETGDYQGTASASPGKLWSAAGCAAMALRVYAGMQLTPDGLMFNPVVPSWLWGTKRIRNLHYRDALLDITINGTGTLIQDYRIDGVAVKGHTIFPSNLTGKHTVTLTLGDNATQEAQFNLTSQRWLPPAPLLQWPEPTQCVITNPLRGERFMVYRNGVATQLLVSPDYNIGDPAATTFYDFAGVMPKGQAGFIQRPYLYYPTTCLIVVQPEDFTAPGSMYVREDRINSRVVQLTQSPLSFEVTAPEDGDYLMSVSYANGAGPVNTGSQCCIRSVMLENERVGTLVMPQRGQGEWLNMGYSNMICVHLLKGVNHMALSSLPCDRNMTGNSGTAIVDYIRFLKL